MSKHSEFIKIRDELEWEAENGKVAYFQIDGLLSVDDLYPLSKDDAIKMARWILDCCIDEDNPKMSTK
jgi:hypothetical protein